MRMLRHIDYASFVSSAPRMVANLLYTSRHHLIIPQPCRNRNLSSAPPIPLLAKAR